MKPTIHSANDLGFDRSRISRNAQTVVEALQRAGFDGYLVGGCIRDLLIGRQPKDFDVTTNASPEQVRDLFKRARIIGRRFRLVHVPFGRGRDREIVEVATYRAAAEHGDSKPKHGRPTATHKGRILDDNVYGTIEADAIRRDFTINAIYYDPVAEQVVDFLDGVGDAKSRKLKIIGNPEIRFKEDPVRMLRVVRFQAKLGLEVAREISASIDRNAELLSDVPPARLFDEVLKLFHHATAHQTWKLLRPTKLARCLFSQTLDCLEKSGGKEFELLILAALANTDRRVASGKPVIPGFLFAVLLWQPFKEELKKIQEKSSARGNELWIASDIVFSRQNQSVTIPYRVRTPALEIWEMQARLERRRPRTILPILDNRRFRAAYDFLLLREGLGEVSGEIAAWWTEIQDCDSSGKQEMIAKFRQTSGPQGKRKSKSRRRSRSHKRGQAEKV